ncbi:hypothetical protein [Sphingobium scionense]|uniref:Uncharacterized protein n=1 Tax=Sphingobium scionense TaxID=1404341 RepID=A0A7W6PVA0_9SPHN|nr:hypothetical protein [Sphingobium scionense]MBB4149215.1 hypothetical protein [Sphingobium scionense]
MILPVGIGLLLAIALAGVMIDPVQDKRQFTAFLFIRQDLAPAILIALLCRFGLSIGPQTRIGWMDRLAQRPWVIALALALFCWAGHHWLLRGYDLTRDEQMANFDAMMFAQGRLFWPIAPAWRPIAEALNQFFMLPIADRQAWVSSYLPINAAARALIGMSGDPGLTSPLFTGVGALALWRIADRLWPGDVAARTVALLLYAGSSQVVIQGMTAHAMAGHLALNLLWLLLFLRGRWSHAGAILIGFLATGLHQPLFHPLFVFPILAGLLLQRRWPLALLYGAAYAVIGLFWLAWPNLIAQWAGGPMEALSSTGDRLSYADRIFDMLAGFGPVSLWLMAMNLLRFIAWQHLLLLPLAAAGVGLAWRAPLVRPLMAGVVLHIMLVGLLLAFQGHGWGYRYLHGLIGSLCLLAAQGWIALRGHWPGTRLWAWGNGATFLLLLPLHMAMAAWLTLPYAQISAQIDAMPADIVIVDDGAVAFGSDLVVNRPDLSNRPIRLLGGNMTVAQVATLCRDHRVAFVGSTQLQPIRRILDAEPVEEQRFRRLRSVCTPSRP